MNKEEKIQKMANRLGTIMICYVIIALVMLLMRGWNILDIVCFAATIINFILFQFVNVNKIIISLFCIIIGLVSVFFLSGIVIIFGLIMAVYGIIMLYKMGS